MPAPSREDLVNTAIQENIDGTLARKALYELDEEAIVVFFHQLGDTVENCFADDVIAELIQSADDEGNLLEIANLLIDLKTDSLGIIAYQLLEHPDNPETLPFLRKMRTLDWASNHARKTIAETILQVLYKYDAKALEDEDTLVRIVAVEHFLQNDSIEALIKALQNDIPDVRRKAAWYMGQKKISSSNNALLTAILTETNIEALRAIVWSLGILRVYEAKEHLKKLLLHENVIIRSDAEQALKLLI